MKEGHYVDEHFGDAVWTNILVKVSVGSVYDLAIIMCETAAFDDLRKPLSVFRCLPDCRPKQDFHTVTRSRRS